MPLLLFQNTCILPPLRRVKRFTRFFPSGMIFTKAYAYTSDQQVEKSTGEFNMKQIACIGSLIYLLSTRVDLSYAVHKLAEFSSKSGKVHFEGLVHLFRYIRENKNLGLKYYADINDAPLSNLLRQAIIKTGNQLMVFFYSSWKYFPETGKSTGSYLIFYQCKTIDHGTHVPGPVSQSSAKLEYNSVCTAGMDFRKFQDINS